MKKVFYDIPYIYTNAFKKEIKNIIAKLKQSPIAINAIEVYFDVPHYSREYEISPYETSASEFAETLIAKEIVKICNGKIDLDDAIELINSDVAFNGMLERLSK